MAPDHHTSDRVYAALKLDLLDGAFGAGRFNITALEDHYATSATPVREALLRLVGEGLIGMWATGGFGALQPSLRDTQQLYEFNRKMVLLAANWPDARVEPARLDEAAGRLDPPVDMLFIRIAEASGNGALCATMATLNDRLHLLRRAEQIVLVGIDRDYRALRDALASDDGPALRRAITAYHARRVRNAAAIIRAVGRAP